MDDFEKFAADRSHNDGQAASDQALASANSLILVNGGAATATLAFAASYNGNLATYQVILFALGLACYAIGVVVGLYNLKMLNGASFFFMLAWQERAHGNIAGWHDNRALADEKQRHGNAVFIAGYALFLAGTMLLGTGMLVQRTMVVNPPPAHAQQVKP